MFFAADGVEALDQCLFQCGDTLAKQSLVVAAQRASAAVSQSRLPLARMGCGELFADALQLSVGFGALKLRGADLFVEFSLSMAQLFKLSLQSHDFSMNRRQRGFIGRAP